MALMLSPIESEFATVETAEDYDRWFHAKVQRAMNGAGPTFTHDEVAARMEAIVRAAEKPPAHTLHLTISI